MEIRGKKLVQGEKLPQNVEKLHQSRRDIFRYRQIPSKRQFALQTPHKPWLSQRMVVRPRARGIAHAQEPRGDGVDVFGVEFVEITVVVDEEGALERVFGEGVVADAVVREIVEHFEGKKVTGDGDVCVPGEDGAVDDFDVVGVAPRRRGTGEL